MRDIYFLIFLSSSLTWKFWGQELCDLPLHLPTIPAIETGTQQVPIHIYCIELNWIDAIYTISTYVKQISPSLQAW